MTVREARRQFTVVFGVFGAIALVALVVLLTPLGGARKDRDAEFSAVREQLHDQQVKSLPLRNIDQKLTEARQQIAAFTRDRLPVRDSAIPEELGRVANENGVRFASIRYNPEDTATEGLRRVEITASVAGDYSKVVKFINALERDKIFFIVNSISLAEQQAGNVRLELKFDTYMKAGA